MGHPGSWQMSVWGLNAMLSETLYWSLWSDPDEFAMLYAACAMGSSSKGPFDSDSDDSEIDQAQLLETFSKLRKQHGDFVTALFTRHYINGLRAHLEISNGSETRESAQKKLKKWQAELSEKITSHTSPQKQNLEHIRELLDLSPTESDLLTLQLNADTPGFRELLMVGSLSAGHNLLDDLLSVLLARSKREITDALDEDGVLVSSGLLKLHSSPRALAPISPHLRETLSTPASEEDFYGRFCKPLERESTTASLARLDERDVSIMLPLLEAEPPEEGGTHILIYGSRAIDKPELISRYLDDSELEPWMVASKHVPSTDMPLWTFIAQEIISLKRDPIVLVVPKAEQALAQSGSRISLMSLFGEAPMDDEEELRTDDALTENGIRCVWLSDQPRFLTESNIGKFIFHCQARPGSRADRRARIEAVVSDFNLSPDVEAKLSRYSLLGARQVEQAAALAERLSDDSTERERVILRAVDQSQRVLRRDATEELRDSVTKYSLDYLNLDGRFSADQVIKALQKKPKGSICFYGIPGTGKTQLAEYMAVELDLPIVKRRASDLLSKWLGESEQNIAQMFAEAEAEGAILFLDEADSFLRERADARAEWSVTQVNEILQQIERFEGVFIAATNLFQSLDAASLRRFTFKLEFKPLRDDQAWEMFCNETEYDPKADPAEAAALKDDLAQISNLAPGDFATVKRQAVLLDEVLSPLDWIEQLRVEAKLKMSGIEKHKIGFG